MTLTPHVSRWRLCRSSPDSARSETCLSSLPHPSRPVAKVSSSTPRISLRYLNEFVGKLHCAPALLQHGLFPDAKEVTESMAMFNAVRRYIEPKSKEKRLKKSDKHDGIVVVGDGNTPRTAAMFAYRMQGWMSYSVDPALEKGTSERLNGWADVLNLEVVCDKIENVRISLRRAIVVLVHAHVTLDQALSAVQAEQICGVVTLPCCNWYGQQESLFGRGPDLVYDDFSVLSDHREIRLWIGDEPTLVGSNADSSHSDLSLASSVMKGCVCKELVAINENEPGTSFDKEVDTKQADGVLDFFCDTLAGLARDTSLLSRKECMAEEQAICNSLSSAVMSNLGTDSHVLVFGWHPRRMAVRLLLRHGYTDVYTISLADDLSFSCGDNSECGTKTLQLQLYKCTRNLDAKSGNAKGGEIENIQLEPCGCFTLQSSFDVSSADKCDNEETVTVSFVDTGLPVPPLACIVDAGFIFRGFCGRAKKPPTFFRRLCRTFDQFVAACGSATDNTRIPSLVCLTPRKQWRKKMFLAHVDLNYDVLSLKNTENQTREMPMYAYCCFKRQTVSGLERPEKTEASDEITTTRDARETWLEFDHQLDARKSELEGELVVINSSDARVKASLKHAVAEAHEASA